MVLPEPALGLGGTGGNGSVHRLLAPVREVPPFDPQRPILYVLFVEFRFHLTGELGAKRSLIVRIFGQNHRRIRTPERRMLEPVSRSLPRRSRTVGLLLRRVPPFATSVCEESPLPVPTQPARIVATTATRRRVDSPRRFVLTS